MSKQRACYNCLHYEDRTPFELPIGARPEDHSGAGTITKSFTPRCLRGLNPSLAQAPPYMGERMQGAFEPDTMAAFCDDYLWAPRVMGDKLRAFVRLRLRKEPRFNTVNLPEKFVKFWGRGTSVRIKIERGETFRYTETGYVGISVGHEPAFLLIRSVNGKRSNVLLREDDRIVGVRSWPAERSYKFYRDES